jgi:hypothetical protein
VTAVEFDPQPWDAYEALERIETPELLDAIDDALDRLEDDPGSKLCRARSFGDGRWGITVRSRADDLWPARKGPSRTPPDYAGLRTPFSS